MLETILFFIFGTVAILAGIFVITQRNVVHSAMFLAAALLAVAGIFLTLHAEFLAGVQVIVYVGGILGVVRLRHHAHFGEPNGDGAAIQPPVDPRAGDFGTPDLSSSPTSSIKEKIRLTCRPGCAAGCCNTRQFSNGRYGSVYELSAAVRDRFHPVTGRDWATRTQRWSGHYNSSAGRHLNPRVQPPVKSFRSEHRRPTVRKLHGIVGRRCSERNDFTSGYERADLNGDRLRRIVVTRPALSPCSTREIGVCPTAGQVVAGSNPVSPPP